MTREDFTKRVEKRIDLVRQTLLTKHKEYAKDDNVFRNFDEAAGGLSLHSTSAEVLWSYMTKHLVSIKDIVSDNTPVTNEVVSEKIGDVINYLILLEAMLNEKGERYCKLKEAYQKHKLYNKTAVDRLSMWTSDYTKNTDMLGLVKMAANGSDRDIDKLKYYNKPGEERGY
jgi:hypothetical protein